MAGTHTGGDGQTMDNVGGSETLRIAYIFSLEQQVGGGQIAICHTFPLVDRSRALVAEPPATPSNSYLLLCTTHARKIFFCRTLTEKTKMS